MIVQNFDFMSRYGAQWALLHSDWRLVDDTNHIVYSDETGERRTLCGELAKTDEFSDPRAPACVLCVATKVDLIETALGNRLLDLL